jgi:hypothetical protein
MSELSSHLEFVGHGFAIHLVAVGNEDHYALYVHHLDEDQGAVIAYFDPGANLAMVLSFLMTLKEAEPVRGSAEIRALLQEMHESEGGPQVDPE